MALTTENLFLEILNGPQKGQRVKIQEGLRIGRTQGEFKVSDPKISGLHGEVVKHYKKGIFIFMDRGSTHKIIFDGRKVNRVALLPGIEFVLGETRFQVKKLSLVETLSVESPEVPSEREGFFPLIKKVKTFFAQNVVAEFPKKIEFFPYPVKLTWTRGIEMGREEVFSFGPRQVGSQGSDLMLFEPSAPPIAFELKLAPENSDLILFSTPYPNLVIFNGRSIPVILVDDLKTIEIGSTEITVSPIKEIFPE
ncbi:MAG: FHA domain-containing protein [Bdellovibrionaceae bacterium]|nr:FHA domain-containing protein [Pseudobdellovibrionaceae bacterium]MDW8190773.1 FHA domain-containing protein [Pseudobdellovibrionaceae bacterium]